MSGLAQIIDAADPALAPYAVAAPGSGRFEGVEGVRGYLMHYGEPRAFAGMDEDMRLLAGDAMYALGLSRLAEAGDLEAVAVLSDLISQSARAHAEGRPEEAEALWESSAESLASTPR